MSKRLCITRFQVFHNYLPHKLHDFNDMSCESSDRSQVMKMFHKSVMLKRLCITRFHVFFRTICHTSRMILMICHVNLQITLMCRNYSTDTPCQNVCLILSFVFVIFNWRISETTIQKLEFDSHQILGDLGK